MINLEQEAIDIIEKFPLISKKDLSRCLGITTKTLSVYFSRWKFKEKSYISTLAMSDNFIHFYHIKDKKKVNSIAQTHHIAISKAYSYLVEWFKKHREYSICLLENEYSFSDDFRTDLYIKLTNEDTKEISTLLVEVETGSRSIQETVKKYQQISDMQEYVKNVEGKNVSVLVFQDTKLIQKPTLYLYTMLEKYKNIGTINNEVFYHSFDFDKKSMDTWFTIDKNKLIKEVEFKNDVLNTHIPRGSASVVSN